MLEDRLTLTSLLLLSLLAATHLLSNVGALPPTLPEAFYGKVTTNGSPAPDGITVTAQIRGVTRGSTTTSNGNYSMTVNPGAENDTILFYVSGALANQTAMFHSGHVFYLNLNVTLPDIVLSLNPTSLILSQGERGSVEITVTSLHGFQVQAFVFVTGTPNNSGITYSISQNPLFVHADANATDQILFFANETAAIGVYRISIGIYGGNVQRQSDFILVIIKPDTIVTLTQTQKPTVIIYVLSLSLPPLVIFLFLRIKRRKIPYV